MVAVIDRRGDSFALVGACRDHLADAYDHGVVLTETSDLDGLEVLVIRSALAGDPDATGPFAHIDLAAEPIKAEV